MDPISFAFGLTTGLAIAFVAIMTLGSLAFKAMQKNAPTAEDDDPSEAWRKGPTPEGEE